jgi:hypothetical protein
MLQTLCTLSYKNENKNCSVILPGTLHTDQKGTSMIVLSWINALIHKDRLSNYHSGFIGLSLVARMFYFDAELRIIQEVR